MAFASYTCERHGFGVVYDAAVFARLHDPADPRFAAARIWRIPKPVAASVLFTPHNAGPAAIADGSIPSQLVTSDDTPVRARDLSAWDWDDVTLREAGAFCRLTGVDSLEATALYWRGYPVLQLATTGTDTAAAAVNGEDGRRLVVSGDAEPTAARTAPSELLALLYTPLQTYSALLTLPGESAAAWSGRFLQLMDGFFLWPLEREGRVRTVHQFVWSSRVEAHDLRDDLAAR